MNSSRIIRNTGYLYLKMAITMFITLYSTRLLLEALGVVDFGIFNVVGGLIAMLGFVNNSMAVATQRFMSFVIWNKIQEPLHCYILFRYSKSKQNQVVS